MKKTSFSLSPVITHYDTHIHQQGVHPHANTHKYVQAPERFVKAEKKGAEAVKKSRKVKYVNDLCAQESVPSFTATHASKLR